MALLYDTDPEDLIRWLTLRLERIEVWVNRPGIRALVITNIVLPLGLALITVVWQLLQPTFIVAKLYYSVACMALIYALNMGHMLLYRSWWLACAVIFALNATSYYCGTYSFFLALGYAQSCLAAFDVINQ